MDDMPSYYHESRVMRANINAQGTELDSLRLFRQDILDQWFIRTATWGLERWEKELGIVTDLQKPLEHRRAVVESKLRGIGTVTRLMIQNVAQSYERGSITVIMFPREYRFMIKFLDTLGVPPNLQDLKDAVEEIKPAHLTVDYQLRYLTIAEVEAMTIWENEHTTQDRYLGGGA